jgi:CHAT domain-containing protein
MQRFYSSVLRGSDLGSALHAAQLSLQSLTHSQLAQLPPDAPLSSVSEELSKASLDAPVCRGKAKARSDATVVQAVQVGARADTRHGGHEGGGGCDDAGELDASPLEHYKHWAGVVLIGSSRLPWPPPESVTPSPPL